MLYTNHFVVLRQLQLLLLIITKQSARCVKASIRYNTNGEFNQSPANRRKGMRPDKIADLIHATSNLLKGSTAVTSKDYALTVSIIMPGFTAGQGDAGECCRRYVKRINRIEQTSPQMPIVQKVVPGDQDQLGLLQR